MDKVAENSAPKQNSTFWTQNGFVWQRSPFNKPGMYRWGQLSLPLSPYAFSQKLFAQNKYQVGRLETMPFNIKEMTYTLWYWI